MRVLITSVMETLKRHVLNISNMNRFINVVSAWKKFKHSVGFEVEVGVVTVLAEGEAWLARTGGVGGISGSDIILSGPTPAEDWNQQ